MKREYHHTFKECLSFAASVMGVSFGQLMRDRHVADFLLEDVSSDATPQTFAIEAMMLCEGDGTSLDKAICLAVEQFLEELCAMGKAAGDELSASRQRRLKDLRDLLRTVAPLSDAERRSQWEKWVQAWYP
jgi:uncharacterized protein YicC (UPF0701 family)